MWKAFNENNLNNPDTDDSNSEGDELFTKENFK